MGFGDWTNIILALALLIFGLRDIFVNNTAKDYSKSRNPLVSWFLSKKEQVTAKHFVRALGFPTLEDFRKQVKKKKSHNYRGAIRILSKCIIKSEDEAKYSYGSDSRHQSLYYVDSMGFAQKKENCMDLYSVMIHLISKIETDYEYVFSIKGGNIPLATAFSMDNNSVLSIIAKDKNEMVNSGNNKDNLINYEGLRDLVEKAQENESREIKGIAIACNLANGSNFLDSIKAYNEKIEELKGDGTIPQNIQKIENVYILYRAIKGEELDSKFENAGLKCYRYFDLDDDFKACLYEIQNNRKRVDDFPCHKCIKGKKKRNCTAKHCYKLI